MKFYNTSIFLNLGKKEHFESCIELTSDAFMDVIGDMYMKYIYPEGINDDVRFTCS